MTPKSSMSSGIPLPSLHIGTRVVLPAVIVLSALAILAWSSWRAWAPLTTVRAVPVIIRAANMNAAPTSPPRGAVVQAPGWVEPSPFPIAETFKRAQLSADAGEGSRRDAIDAQHALNLAKLELNDLERQRRGARLGLAKAAGFLPAEVMP